MMGFYCKGAVGSGLADSGIDLKVESMYELLLAEQEVLKGFPL
jgi:hypothetical protein